MRAAPLATAAASLRSVLAASAEDRSDFYVYADRHAANAALTEPGSQDAARLIVRALCVAASARRANDLIRTRPEVSAERYNDYSRAFTSSLSGMEREPAKSIYNIKVEALRAGDQ